MSKIYGSAYSDVEENHLNKSSLSVCWSGEISTIPIIQAGSGRNVVTLECNYTLTGKERVYPGGIAWEVEKLGHYEEIATFSPPDFPDDINSFSSTESGLMFMNRSELLNVTTIAPSSFYVAMRVTDLECSDENKYKCVIDLRNTAGPSPLESSSSLIFRCEYTKLFFIDYYILFQSAFALRIFSGI